MGGDRLVLKLVGGGRVTSKKVGGELGERREIHSKNWWEVGGWLPKQVGPLPDTPLLW